MLVSEKEAKFKYCPYLKTNQDQLKFCQGDMCMMWRWEQKGSTKGYCGLAGKPDGVK